MEIRRYESADCPRLAALFRETVWTVNAGDYTAAQREAWMAGSADLAAWDRSFRAHLTLVALEGERIVGFGDMDETGYLDRLYVHKDYQRRGIASAICDALERAVPGPVTTHASLTARGFFEKRGYRALREQEVERRGVRLRNVVMVKERR
ncbi:MAG: GNAT family N-acetyltransferase [Oscillospiraceae bacterium]